MAKLKIRKDRTSTVLRKLAKSEPDARISRRLLGIANALDGMSRAEAAKCAGMDRQTLRDWVLCHEHRRSTRRCATVLEMKEGPSGSAIRSLIPSHRERLWSKATVVSVAETSGR